MYIAISNVYSPDTPEINDFTLINSGNSRVTGEFISKYFVKGNRIALEGSIQTRTWQDAEGKNRYSTEVVVEQCEFAQSKSEGGAQAPYTPSSNSGLYPVDNTPAVGDIDGFMPIEEDDLPF